MINARPILTTTGATLCAFAAAMMLPALVDLADANRDWQVFAASSLVTFFIGTLLILVAPARSDAAINLRTGFVLTTAVWLSAAAFSGLPFIGVGLNYTDAYFEAMSGLTTTGSTVLVHLDDLPRGILLWRSILQMIGGIGIVVTAILLLPFLRIGGMQLFLTESSDTSEKLMPRAIEISLTITGIYALLLGVCALSYLLLGMTLFDAVCHAFTTVSTGGFSTHDASFGFFTSAAQQWVCILFMILGSLPFTVLYRCRHFNLLPLIQDQQARAYVIIIICATAAVFFYLETSHREVTEEALRKSAFHVVSIISTTGFATEDYTTWGPFSVGIFLLLTFIGGCSGSTSGGIKIYRLQIAGLLSRSHLGHLLTPHWVAPLAYNGRRVEADVAFSVIAFLFAYMTTALIFALALTATGIDILTALSASIQAIANVGPGLGEIIGPAGNFSALPDLGKWLLSFEMLLGRLELFTMLVLLMPTFWKW
jgi:trk system potassium uptake protein TrkH